MSVPVSPRPLNLAVVLEAMADAVPNRNAVVTIDREYTYAEIDERATRLANHSSPSESRQATTSPSTRPTASNGSTPSTDA